MSRPSRLLSLTAVLATGLGFLLAAPGLLLLLAAGQIRDMALRRAQEAHQAALDSELR
jgi:hypothetical protein